jgi:hypothetical protein
MALVWTESLIGVSATSSGVKLRSIGEFSVCRCRNGLQRFTKKIILRIKSFCGYFE